MHYNNFQEAIQAILDEPIDNAPVSLTNRDHFSDENLLILETYTDFLDALPKETYYQIARELMELLLIYQDGMTHDFNKYLAESLKLSLQEEHGEDIIISEKPSPSIAIKKDIKVLEEARNILDRHFGTWKYALGLTEANSTIKVTNIQDFPYEAFKAVSFIDSLIIDIKSKKFDIAEKTVYYEHPTKSKNSLKNYLDEIIKKYNLKSTTVSKKELIDSIK
jgi:hypothetical protein